MDARARSVTYQPQPVELGWGEHMVRLGAVAFGVGLLAVLVVLVPFFVGTDPMPLALYLLASLAPIGFGVALIGMFAGVRARRRPRASR